MSYSIEIKRKEKQGNLRYFNGDVSIDTNCYWNLDKRIPAGQYIGCSATTMVRKKNSKGTAREGIFIPNVKGFSQIFIHYGLPGYFTWSQGCIIIPEDKILAIYNDISPKNGNNLTVTITD